MNKFVLCQDAKIVNFVNLPIVAGITTSQLGNFHSTEPSVTDKYDVILEKFNCSSFVQLVPNHGETILNPSNFCCTDKANFLVGDAIIYGDSPAGCLTLVHCSWATLAKCIIENTLNDLSLWTMKPVKSFSAFIYPGICQECYEVRADVKEKFNDYGQFFKPYSKGSWLMDLSGIIRHKLIANGILPKNISSVEFCPAHSTFAQLFSGKEFCLCDDPVMFSYRRWQEEKRNIIFASLPEWPHLVTSTTGDCPYVIFYQTK